MNENPPNWNLETMLVHTGERQVPQEVMQQGMPTSLPIYATSTFLQEDADALDAAFEPPAPGAPPAYMYARYGNPTVAGLEQAVAAIEHGKGAVAFGSGMAALHAALLAAGVAPDETVLAASNLYGATTGMLQKVFAPQGVRIITCDVTDTAAVCQTIEAEQPSVLMLETLSNPLLQLCDLPTIAKAAQRVGATTVVDSTFSSPILIRPLELGIDIVVHSATKYLGGHGDALGGVAIANSSFHLEALSGYMRMLGAVLSPFEARLIMRGLKTLSLRMERHCANAAIVAAWLAGDARVSRVHYPGLPSHPQHELAKCLLHGQLFGGMVSFEIRDADRAAVHRFMDALRLCLCGTSLGDVYSLVSYSALSSHRNLTPAQRAAQGISDGLVRLSVGIEHPDDIIADLDHALTASQTPA